MDLIRDKDKPSAAMAEEDFALATEESAPAPKQKPRHRPWELCCRRPALQKVSTLHERSSPCRVVVAAKGD
jgi:hypothetical protein